MDDQEIAKSADALVPATPTPPPSNFARLTTLMQQSADAGWLWDEKAQTLTHPRDAQLQFLIDPVTRKLSLSPRLAWCLSQGSSGEQHEQTP